MNQRYGKIYHTYMVHTGIFTTNLRSQFFGASNVSGILNQSDNPVLARAPAKIWIFKPTWNKKKK